MEIIEEKHDNALVCRLAGRLDGQTSAEATARLAASQAEAAGKPILLDLSELDYLSSAGLRVILVAAKSAKAAGSRLSLCAPTPEVKEILDISGFGSILPIHASREEALADA